MGMPQAWGPGWRGTAESGPHTAGTERGSYGRSLDCKEGKSGHTTGITHKGEIMRPFILREFRPSVACGMTGFEEGQ